MIYETVTAQTLEQIRCLDLRRMAGGLHIVTSSAEHERRPREVLRAQKLLIFLFMKYVNLPSRSTRIPDPLGLRPAEAPPEFLHLLNRYRNTAFHLQHPLADKLQAQRVGLPCLLLMPGPSLARIEPHCAELAKRYLILTISRVLPFLRRVGVTPDILVQLDTVPIQQHFHRPGDSFPESVLLALSLAPIRGFAPGFRQLFFIDSFDRSVLPNPFRVRESWLSSLLACLGCAETLCAPNVLLAGADLRLCGESTYYSESPAGPDAAHSPYTLPLETAGDRVTLADANGRHARTTLQYLATAAEAEMFARDIQASTGTVFRTLSPWSLLDQEVFAPLDVADALAAPPLDRAAFLAKADAAAAMPERINLRSLRALYSRNLAEAKKHRDLVACLRLSDPEALRQHPCTRYVEANIPWFRPEGAENREAMAGNLASELYDAARFARNVASLHLTASTGAALTLLCTAEEEAEALERLKAARPGWSWRCLGARVPDTGRPEPSGGALELRVLADWLRSRDVVVVAPGFAREYHYVLSLADDDNRVSLEELTAHALRGAAG